ncbi:hypothetical protein VB780_11790 [Leptolyngbya sp. CCNP1308]|uniref:hypothetical protein n=1 Tax=Leptolyngbya sp. CCNP1308 TaxID=3110255 RepID=UPI002B1E9BB4|nr:hypothetical protein [Leptolyngbya sp. CCNP1308]MEA5449255.1 hypothetical protein [Leptolyngbya sp. CCNP1308]
MHQYIADTQYAVHGLIELITAEERELSQLQSQHEGISRKVEYLHQSLLDAQFNDVAPLREQAIAIDSHRASEDLADLQKQIIELQNSISIKGASIDALCGAIFQIAKQGISTVHGGLDRCPDGRSIGKGAEVEKLKNVVWQARNQSMHYEEGSFQSPVTNCFSKLEASLGSKFSLSENAGKNLAHNVIQELGWKDYLRYESDMQSLI